MPSLGFIFWAAWALFFAGACSDSSTPGGDAAAKDMSIVDTEVSETRADVGDLGTGYDTRGEADLRAVDQGSSDVMIPVDVKGDAGAVVSVTWVKLKAGIFTMGSPSTEQCRFAGEEEEHQVTLTHDFELRATEVTQKAFKDLMGSTPSKHHTGSAAPCATCPVDHVSWYEAVAYCNALSVKKGLDTCYPCTGSGATLSCKKKGSASIYECKGYRLPTESEWEYAYRAGSTTAYYTGNGGISTCNDTTSEISKIAWYYHNSNDTTHEVGKKTANKWGLYDMAGNVQEWCHDWYDASYPKGLVTDPVGAASGNTRSLRGGSYDDISRYLRAAARQNFNPSTTDDRVGFRCARKL